MNFTGACASMFTATGCVKFATGEMPQSLFADGALWIWWVLAAIWLANAVCFVVKAFCD